MKTNLRTSIVTAVLALLVFVGGANAALVSQLGILDLAANSGMNPATNAAWAHGDTYRLVFTTSTIRDATSTDINDYNAFVQSAANNSSLGLGGVSWNAIASTATVDARDNTSTNIGVNGTGESIFLLNGSSVVAANYEVLWNSDSHTSSINLTEELTTPPNDLPGATRFNDTWTGTDRHTFAEGTDLYGTADPDQPGGGPLGDPDGSSRTGLWGFTSGTHWIYRFEIQNDSQLPFYALSEVLTVVDPALAAVPEPTTATLAMLGLGGIVMRRRRNTA